MGSLRVAILAIAVAACVSAATIGTVFNLTGGASDLVLDEPRGRLYLVRPSPYNQIDVYSIPQRRILASIPTDAFPLAAALSPDGSTLYVTCHDGSALNAIDVANMAVAARVSLPARPEGVAVGNDGRVLVTTIGAGANNLLNTLLIYDPYSTDRVLQTVPVTAPPPMPPQLPPPAGRSFLASRSQLIATQDGTRIIGVNRFNNTTAVVFVYEVASGTVLRSRLVGDTSTVLSVSPDGTKFMMGLRLYETDTLTVLAQQNAANAPFPLNANTAVQGFNLVAQQFNTQQNQGGSVFAPDGGTVYSAFNIAPVQNPPTRPNVSGLLFNDPDNLLIRTALQLPENLAGKTVISSDGGSLYALSESGIMTVPLNQVMQNPVAVPESPVVLLANDMCGVTAAERRLFMTVRNEGRGQMPPLPPTLVQSTAIVGPPGLGGIAGPGGGAPGGGIIIVLPPAPGAGLPGQLPAGMNPQQQQIAASAPAVRATGSPEGTLYEFTFNAANARSLGTVTPHDYLVTAPTAVNIPRTVRVFQNQRDPEARAQLVPVEVGVSANEGLTDIVADSLRQVAYIANSGKNRVEVFDMQSRSFHAPIKVGQLPRAMALSPDGATLYVANTGGESISVIDLDKREVVGRIRFPPIPFNGNIGVITPSVLAVSQRGLQIVMSNGTLWRVVGEDAIPRPVSAQIGTATIPAPRTMTSTPNGEFILLLDGNGNAYLYDALVDDYVARRQVATPPITGYYGPVTAGPRGQFYVVNGLVLNQSLSPISGTGMVPGAATRPVAAVTAASGSTYARFTQPVRANANAVVADNPAVEIVDANTGALMRSIPVVEGPLSAVVGNQRANVVGRTMAVDVSSNTALVLTTSGLTVVNLDPPALADRPAINQNGVVNLASRTAALAQGGLVSIFGRNLGGSGSADGSPAPTILGETCVTLGSTALPLTMTSSGQVNAHIPANIATGRYALTVRSVERKLASVAQQVTIAKYAPAAFTDSATGYASVYHSGGDLVTPDNPAKRDQRLVLYAAGLGPTKAVAGATPGSPTITDPVKVFFGDNRYSYAEIIVESSTLVPGLLGVYEIRLYVPGDHMRGDKLPVTIRIGNVTSPLNGPVVPVIAVD